MRSTVAFAQLTGSPVTNGCACNGSMSYIPPDATPTNYLLISLSNGTNYTFNSTSGFTQNGLCGGTYLLQTTINGATTQAYYTLTAQSNDIVPHGQLARCSTSASFNLTAALPGLPAGGTWYDPAGNPTVANQNTSTALEGFYAYAYGIGGCPIATGVLVDINEPPNTGNQTTTLICDTWLPFEMLLYMQGAPDPGGQWFNALGVPMDGIFDPATMSSALFTYMIDNVPGCAPAYTTMYIQENVTPNPGLPSTILVCEEGPSFNMFIHLEGTPTPGGTWTNGLNQNVSSTFTPGISAAGTYTYSIDALTPCVDQDVTLTINVTSNDPSGDPTLLSLCSNTPGFDLFDQLQGSPLPGGTWTTANGNVFNGGFSVQGTGAGTYYYYYPNVGCNPQGAEVQVSIEPLLNAGNNYSGTICSSAGTLNLQALLSSGAATSGTWYNASNQIINPVITLNEAAEQQYTYFINGNVCPDDYSFFDIFVDIAPPPLNDTSLVLCASDGNLDLGSLYPMYPSITFHDALGNPTAPIFDPSSGAMLAVIAELPSGNICSSSQADVNVNVEVPFALAPITATICENTTIINLLELAPSLVGIAGTWYDANGQTVPNISSWNPALLEYSFIPSGFMACPADTAHLVLNVSSFVDSDTLDQLIFCALDDAFPIEELLPIDWSSNGEWSLAGQPIPMVFDPSVASDGDYNYTIPGQGSCPEATLHIPIDIVPAPAFDLGPDQSYCASQNTVPLGSNNTTYNFNWSPSLYLNDPDSSSPLLTASPDSSQITVLQYEVSISNNACTVYDTLNITFYPLPELNLQEQYELCYGDGLTLSLPIGNTYQWSPAFAFDNPSSNIQTLQPTGTTTIHIEAQNIWNCIAETDVTIAVWSNPEFIVLSEPQSGCYAVSDTLRALADQDYQFEWQIGEAVYQGDSIFMNLSSAGTYDMTVTATDSNGCQTTESFPAQYTLHPSPTAIFETTPDQVTTVNNTIAMVNQTTTAQSFEWTLDGGVFSALYQPELELPGEVARNFEFCQIATNNFGCQDTTCRWVYMDSAYLMWVPNAFTPDGDAINDVFFVTMMGFDEASYSLQVLDRWGVEVFRSNDPQEVWVGDHQGGQYYCQPDTYAWIVSVKKKDSAEYETFRGHITLIR